MMTSARSQSFVQVTSDQRKKLFVSGTVNRAFDPNGEFDQRVFGLAVTYRPTGALNLSISPQWNLRDPTMQYVGTAASAAGPRYVLASLQQRTLSLTARVNYSITPSLTVQFYGQPFVSAGRYSEFKQVTDPRAAAFASRFRVLGAAELARAHGRLVVDENQDGTSDYSLRDPDFGFREFRSNLVVRWEYSPGSTLFVVWSQGRTGVDGNGSFSAGGGLRDLFEVAPNNVFLVKISRWLSF